MSTDLRRQAGFWIMLILGVGLLIVQIKRYYDGSLEFTLGELTVTMLGVIMVINPMFFLTGLSRYFSARFARKDDSNPQKNDDIK